MSGSQTRIYQDGRLTAPKYNLCKETAVVVRKQEKGSPIQDGSCEWARCTRCLWESHDPPQREEQASFV